MSVAPGKKRGRPKKAVSESISAENIEPVKNGSRQKSTETSIPPTTKTSNKVSKLLTVQLDDAPNASIRIQKKTSKAQAPLVATNTLQPSPEATSEMLPVPLNSSTTSSPPKVTSTNSKILNQVRALSSKAPSAAKSSRTTSKTPNPTAHASPAKSKDPNSPSHTNIAKPSAPPPSPKPSPPKKEQERPVVSQPAVSDTSSSQSSRSPPTSQPQTPHPQKSIPIAALNSSIVSQISSRAGARPGRPPTDLPPKYKSVARRVTLAIVALPVAVVTSWVLYQRREERKELVRPGMVLVDESPSMRETRENVSEKDA